MHKNTLEGVFMVLLPRLELETSTLPMCTSNIDMHILKSITINNILYMYQ